MPGPFEAREGREEEVVTGLESSNLRKLYAVSAALTGIVFLIAAASAGLDIGLGILYGGIFGIVNTWLIACLTRAVLDPQKRNPLHASTAFLLKFPVVYGMLVLGFARHWINLVGFVIGFQIFFLSLFIWAILTYRTAEKQRGRQGDDAG